MQKWKTSFDTVALGKGMSLFQDGKVENLKNTEENISASLATIPRYEVSITMDQGKPTRMKCQCPKYRSGRNCEHMAAVLYAVTGGVVTAQKKKEQEEKKRQEAEKRRIEREMEARRALEEAARQAAEEEAQKREREEKERARAAAQAAKKAAEEEAAREKARAEVAERIARREAEKKAKKAERKRKRMEAEQALVLAAREAAVQKEEEMKKRQEEEKAQAALEEERRAREAEEKKAAQQEAARRKEARVQAAIARKAIEDRALQEADMDENYSYFDFMAIRNDLGIKIGEIKRGRELLEDGQVTLDSLSSGYSDGRDDIMVEVKGSGKRGTTTKNDSFSVMLAFSQKEVYRSYCECSQCKRKGYYWYGRSDCEYVAGLLMAAENYIKEHHIGDATDVKGVTLLNTVQNKHTRQVMAVNEGREDSLLLEPKLVSRNGKLTLSFRVGENKLYVVKDLFELCRMVKNAETGTYGSNTRINHQLEHFTERSRQWYRFISKVVKEEEEMERRMEESWRYSGHNSKCSSLELYGWRLDQFYEEMADTAVAYEDKDGKAKKKEMLKTKEADPTLVMQIRKSAQSRKGIFHGIDVSCRMPVFYQGMDNYYYVKDDCLCRAGKEFTEQIQPLEMLAENGLLDFKVGRNNLSEFYYSFLPRIQQFVQVAEENSKEIHSYLPPEVSFVFYLDAQDRNLTCQVHALYGEREVSVLDIWDDDRFALLEPFRMEYREEEMLYRVRQFFPEVDVESDRLHCGQNEERIYQVLEHGVEELLKYGEVKCTQSFKNRNTIKRAKVAVGVSVSRGLLNLEITSEDISREELLDILKGYRTHKKFYRLKNGDFLNMENDSLKILYEMMETMHLSPKEFVKGKMELPAYRTLYLDKLLEDNADIYLTRDSHFREMVKSFKTIQDADFEEPAELSHIMRGYQKNGYKWMKTLESCGFGGILADDMGLGKTLQMIAVLLSAWEEKKEGCSLVVCPSSLVFNWEEEFHKFAPSLQVLTITGNQEQRQRKLLDWDKYQVLVTSYDLLKRDIHLYEEMQFQYEVIDEAQYIKNHSTAAAKAVKVIQSRLRIALTGTPIENRLSELWSIFDYLMPGFLYGYDVFRREFETPIAKNGDEDMMKRLQRMTGPFILRRLKKDVLKDLPDKLEEVRYVQLEDTQRKAYDAQVVHMQTTLAGQDYAEFSRNKLQMLAELTRLRQICCDPSLCFENYEGESAKRDACLELIQSAIDGGHKILLFSQFTTMLDILKKSLEEAGIAYYTITGDTPKEERLKLVKCFNEDDTPLFLISLKAGGVGLNLTGADVVIHYDPWWNLAAQEQATDRAHRIGQTRKVTVYKLIAKNTVEEKILKLQETKRDLADSIVNAQTGQFAALSKEELLGLLEV